MRGAARSDGTPAQRPLLERWRVVGGMPHGAGLRAKFNLVLLPIVAIGIAAIMWADYRHEYATLMQAHAAHVAPVGAGAPVGPIDPWTLPDAAARRSLWMHLLFGSALLVLVVVAVNLTLQWLILRPIALMHERLVHLQRGQWRTPVQAGTSDELGALYAGVQRLGPEIDALVGQLLRAERLAALALISHRLAARIEPEVSRIGAVAGRMTIRNSADLLTEAELLGGAAANILRAVHEFDAAFGESPHGRPHSAHDKPVRGAA